MVDLSSGGGSIPPRPGLDPRCMLWSALGLLVDQPCRYLDGGCVMGHIGSYHPPQFDHTHKRVLRSSMVGGIQWGASVPIGRSLGLFGL